MSDLGLSLPLRIVRNKESVAVTDNVGRVAAYVYVSDEPQRRSETKRVSPEQGVEIAKVIARALTDRIELG